MPRTAAQNEAIRDKRKDKIMTKTVKLFAMKGFDSITIDDISKASNCAHGLFYHYWEVKEDLYNALVTSFEIKYMDKLIDYTDIERMSAIKAITYIINFYHNVLSENDIIVSYSRLSLTKFYQCKDAEKPLAGVDMFEKLLSLVEQGQKDGSIRQSVDARDIVKVLMSVFLTETELRLCNKKDFEPMDPSILLAGIKA